MPKKEKCAVVSTCAVAMRPGRADARLSQMSGLPPAQGGKSHRGPLKIISNQYVTFWAAIASNNRLIRGGERELGSSAGLRKGCPGWRRSGYPPACGKGAVRGPRR
jgi:hypothetical protein